MNSLTLLETILIIYIISVNVLGVVAIIMNEHVPKKASDMIFGIMFVVAIPIVVPITLLIVLYQMLVDKLKRRKRRK